LPSITVAAFVIDDFNESKFWEHGIVPEQVLAVRDNDHVVVRNRKGRVAEHVVIGRDDSGRCIAAPIVPTHDPYVWRPVTAWYCKPSEAAKLRLRGR
jgi:hypothetical protein